MALIFVGDGENVSPYFIKSGSVLSNPTIEEFKVTDMEVLRGHLTKLKKDDLVSTLNALGLRPNRKSMTIADMANTIVAQFAKLEASAKKKAGTTQASSSGYVAEQPKTDEVSICFEVYDHRAPTLDVGRFTIKIDAGLSVSSLLLVTGEKLGVIFKNLAWKQVVKFNGQYLTNHIWSLRHVGFKSNEANEATVEIFDEDDPEFVKVFMGEDSTDNEEVESKLTWTQQDQKTLELLERLNQDAIKVNYDQLMDMRAKKEKYVAHHLNDNYDMDFFKFCGITEDEWEQYVTAPNDFFENAFVVEVFDNSGDVLLLKVEADKGSTNAMTLKKDIYKCVQNIKNGKGEEVEFDIMDFNINRGAGNYLPYKHDDIIEDNKVFITLKLRGGGKGQLVQKVTTKKKNQLVSSNTTRDDVAVFQNAFTCALTISTLTTNITLASLVEQLSVAQLKALLEKLKHGKENTLSKIESFAEESPSWKQLEQAVSKIESAMVALKQTLTEDIYKVCSISDKFKKSELEKKLEIAIVLKEKSGTVTSSIDVQMDG